MKPTNYCIILLLSGFTHVVAQTAPITPYARSVDGGGSGGGGNGASGATAATAGAANSGSGGGGGGSSGAAASGGSGVFIVRYPA